MSYESSIYVTLGHERLRSWDAGAAWPGSVLAECQQVELTFTDGQLASYTIDYGDASGEVEADELAALVEWVAKGRHDLP